MSWMRLCLLLFLVGLISLGCLFGLAVLFDVLEYRNLQRRLRDERERRHAR